MTQKKQCFKIEFINEKEITMLVHMEPEYQQKLCMLMIEHIDIFEDAVTLLEGLANIIDIARHERLELAKEAEGMVLQ